MPKIKTILAIETSCDDTSIALIRCSGSLKNSGADLKFEVLKNIVSSQIPIHRPFGGVVPNLAKREHIKNLPIVLKKILKASAEGGSSSGGKSLKLKADVNYIAVTVGPGLEPALWTGINFAEELSKKTKIPLIGINHMEGHLYSNWLPVAEVKSQKSPPKADPPPEEKVKSSAVKFPAIALIVSGGHTILLNMKSINKWEKLGETLDDAAGEAFDKVAKMLKLPYPGGPEISKLAPKGNSKAINFPRPMLNKPNYEFSFSGLKTSVLYYLRDQGLKAQSSKLKANVAASFQEAVIDVLNKKTARATKQYKAKSILLCGGVSANKLLRERLQNTAKELNINFIVPDFKYSVDNAAMIAAAAYINFLRKNKKRLKIEAQGNLTI